MILIQIALLLGLIVAASLLLKRFLSQQGASPAKVLFATLGTLLVVLIVVLAASGRLNWLVAIFAAILPFIKQLPRLIQHFPLLNRLWRHLQQGHGQSSSGSSGYDGHSQHSQVSTEFLRMTLDLKSGSMEGEILKGTRQGCFLGELELPELLRLRSEFSDPDSRRLLESYLDQNFPDWSQTSAEGASGGADGGNMDRKRALEILGLDTSAGRSDIIAAHRKLIQRVHPDRGGSSYLAAQLNEAKRILLAEDT